jgi:hypothetical protein
MIYIGGGFKCLRKIHLNTQKNKQDPFFREAKNENI